jgi:hypothetical protein
MATGKQLATVMIAATIAITLFNPISAAVTGSAGEQSVTNETVTANPGNYTALDGYSIVEGSEVVYGFNDSSGSYEQASSPEDYEMAYENGSIKVNSSSGLIEDGEDVKVSYHYQSTSGTTTTVVTLVPLFVGLLILGTLAFKVQGMM